MRVTKDQFLKGIVDYVENEVLPNVEDKATKILIATGVKAIQCNKKLADSVFENNTVKLLLDCQEDGTYEIEEVFRDFKESVKEYGSFLVTIPPLPWISPKKQEFSFGANDVDELKNRIERSNGNG